MLTKQDLYKLAAVGMRQQLLRMERDLATIHKDFPDLFLGPTPPQFVRLETKASGNGHGPSSNGAWPTLRITPPDEGEEAAAHQSRTTSEKLSALWTPERRAAQGRRLRKIQKQIQAKRRMAGRAAKSVGRPLLPIWQRIYAFLLAQPDRTAKMAAILSEGVPNTSSGTAITAMLSHKDLFERQSYGTYRLKREMTEEELQHVRRAPTKGKD
jgi:hypothetical protein